MEDDNVLREVMSITQDILSRSGILKKVHIEKIEEEEKEIEKRWKKSRADGGDITDSDASATGNEFQSQMDYLAAKLDKWLDRTGMSD